VEISDKLRHYRKQKNLTQKELADKLHLSRKTISGWENGRGYPDIKSIAQLSDIFGVSTDDLLKDNNLLEHYDEQNKQSLRARKIVKVTYYLNFIFILAFYGYIFGLLNDDNSITLLILFGNMILFFANYSDWNRFKQKKQLLGMIIAFILLIFLNAGIIPTNNEFFQLIKGSDQAEDLGVFTGEVIIIILLSICVTLAICFYPRSIKRERDSNNTEN
jgi:transcriptional regulator with XRE-family HTH domain